MRSTSGRVDSLEEPLHRLKLLLRRLKTRTGAASTCTAATPFCAAAPTLLASNPPSPVDEKSRPVTRGLLERHTQTTRFRTWCIRQRHGVTATQLMEREEVDARMRPPTEPVGRDDRERKVTTKTMTNNEFQIGQPFGNTCLTWRHSYDDGWMRLITTTAMLYTSRGFSPSHSF
jgi:hypothetical protein